MLLTRPLLPSRRHLGIDKQVSPGSSCLLMGGKPPPTLTLREGPDPHRPAVPLSEAAKLLGFSRSWAETLLKTGRLAGYGLPRPVRTRLYAYHDDVLRLVRERHIGVPLETHATGRQEEDPAVSLRDSLLRAQEEKSRYRADAVTLRETVLRLLSANDALFEAEQARASACRHLRAALDDDAMASELVRRAAKDHAEALRQFVIPGTAADLGPTEA